MVDQCRQGPPWTPQGILSNTFLPLGLFRGFIWTVRHHHRAPKTWSKPKVIYFTVCHLMTSGPIWCTPRNTQWPQEKTKSGLGGTSHQVDCLCPWLGAVTCGGGLWAATCSCYLWLLLVDVKYGLVLVASLVEVTYALLLVMWIGCRWQGSRQLIQAQSPSSESYMVEQMCVLLRTLIRLDQWRHISNLGPGAVK